MIHNQINTINKKYWITFHILLGAISTITPIVLIAYLYYVILFSVSKVLLSKETKFLTHLVTYISSFELLARMSNAAPFIPYELGKYIMFFLFLYGLNQDKIKSSVGYFVVILLIPALFFDYSGQVVNKDLIFNVLGPINIGLGIWFYKDKLFDSEEIWTLLKLMILPLVSSLVFTIIKAPSYSEIEFTLGALKDTTGGFGSNQVSTAFGFGLLIIFIFIYFNLKFSGNKNLDLLFGAGFFLQGLLSFSRGGILGGIIGIFLILRFSINNTRKFNFSTKRLIFLCVVFLSIVVLANNITKGALLLRYQGETAGTLAGTKEKDFNQLTTNRFNILLGDLDLFLEYPILGTGAGASTYLRKNEKGVLTHVEFSRLLAEHGILGLIVFTVILSLGYTVYKRSKKTKYGAILLTFYFVGLYSTFHAATRTYLSPLLIGLSTITIVDKKKSVQLKNSEVD